MEYQPAPRSNLWRTHGQKMIALLVWMLLVGSYAIYYWVNNLTIEQSLQQLLALLNTPYGPLLYLLSFLIRPLLFFSAGLLCIMGGIIFGAGSTVDFLFALGYATVGVICSAVISFGIGRFLGQGLITGGNREANGSVNRYADRLRCNGFLTVLTMRLLLLPFDMVNYLAGLVAVDWKAYTLATAIGILPSTFAFVSFGAAIDMGQLAAGERPQIDVKLIGLAVALFALSLLISRWYKRRERM
ncbi:MAG: VTT domain-containing protein [Caldilineaceae bacterium]